MADHIQIGDISPRIQYTADGSQTAFTYPFPIFKDTDMEVYEDSVMKTLTADYSVSGSGNSAGGTVTFGVASASGVVVTLKRNIAIARTSDFQESGEFRAKVINDELDILTATLQQIESEQERSLSLAPTDSTNTMTLPDKAMRASNFLAFDANGDPIASAAPASGVAASTFGASLIDDADASTARTTMGLVIGADVLSPTGDGSSLTGVGATDAEKANIALNAFRIAVNGGLSVQNMVDGIVDEFTDETGVDTATSTNETYDATNDYYHNPGIHADCVLQMAFDGTDASTTFTDDGPNAHTFTAVANGQLDTAQKKYGTASLLLDGTDDYLAGPSHADWTFGTGDFTVECWIRINAATTSDCIVGNTTTGDAAKWRTYYDTARKIVWGSGSLAKLTGTTALTLATWYHVAIVRVSGTVKIYIDGVEDGSVADSTDYSLTDNLWIGAFDNPGKFDGWIDDLRILKGTGIYTGAFTPPASAHTANPNNVTLVSNATTALAQPDAAFVVLWQEDIDTVTPNTDLKAYASRDDGTTWTQVTLTEEAALSTGRIQTGTADISAQPAGTSMKWKVETLNAKSQRLHGVGLEWS
ncbi:MAG: LamG-like jellyroll fold domain-containing protein [Alphaproteobacteria bacterium]